MQVRMIQNIKNAVKIKLFSMHLAIDAFTIAWYSLIKMLMPEMLLPLIV